MTVNKLLERVDAIKPNVCSAEQKTRWLSELEGLISLNTEEKTDFMPYEYPEDGERELGVSAPYDGMYVFYLYAMIDLHNRDFTGYNNTITMFNEYYDMFAKHMRRGNIPRDNHVIKLVF